MCEYSKAVKVEIETALQSMHDTAAALALCVHISPAEQVDCVLTELKNIRIMIIILIILVVVIVTIQIAFHELGSCERQFFR